MPRANTLSRMSYNRTYQAGRHAALRAEGKCIEGCGSDTPMSKRKPGQRAVRCETCAKLAAKRSKKRMSRLRKGWRGLGLCVVCGKNDSMRKTSPGSTDERCGACADQQSESKANRRQGATGSTHVDTRPQEH